LKKIDEPDWREGLVRLFSTCRLTKLSAALT
jgi:hypothetical protein